MLDSRRFIMVHGHFYQPPRENPRTGQIEPQPSAAPWPDWNSRITAECYLPMARSKMHNAGGRIIDLYNNYAHSSFNFGPTLLSWLAEKQPVMLQHLRDAVTMNRTSGVAQSYSHMMLPLADSRDRHTQILWGLREFYWRFGFYPPSMWLPECGIDKETLRALIDHGIKFIILSPHQASKARPFGETSWRDVSMGAIDTRRAYRLFETDGGGRTHFDRYLDVIFYTPGLNLKVSFDHILNRPEDLAHELEACFEPGRFESQLASVVTDGEIYGHHEKGGESALSRLYAKIAPSIDLTVVTAGEFVRDNPPSWEVKLWSGQDNNGSSWSCEHGMGRWSRDCGCTPSHNPGWDQKWRRPLRDAFDLLRDHIRGITRQELGPLFWDRDDARDDYISVVLDPGHEQRKHFLARHSQHKLSIPEQAKVWRLLEADRNAQLMYTSCGWFFDELSGLEPVQNMCYALRAAELAQPFSKVDLLTLLEEKLSYAKSNLPRWKDGGDVLRRLVLPSRYSDKELAASVGISLALGLDLSDSLSWKLLKHGNDGHYEDNVKKLIWGSFVCLDPILDRLISAPWLVNLATLEACCVQLDTFTEMPIDRLGEQYHAVDLPAVDRDWLHAIKKGNAKTAESADIVGVERLPKGIREVLYRRFTHEKEERYLSASANLGAEAAKLIATANLYGAATPDPARASAVFYVEHEIESAVNLAVAKSSFTEDDLTPILSVRRTAEQLDFWASQSTPSRNLGYLLHEALYWLRHLSDQTWLEKLPAPVAVDGEEWLRPSGPLNHPRAYPEAGTFARAMGLALANWQKALLDRDDGPAGALEILPVPEILTFARKGGFTIPFDLGTGRDFWDFLAKPLSHLIAKDPTGIIAGTGGDRLRRAGSEFGFADEVIEKRLLEVVKFTVNND